MTDWANNGGWTWLWMLPMMFFTILVVCAFIWALVSATQSGGTTTDAKRPTAEDILNERFAQGEIDAPEYRERIEAVHGNRAKTRS